jgi:hypothetical protein
MSHPRRGFIQAGLALLGSVATARLVAGQDRRSDGCALLNHRAMNWT